MAENFSGIAHFANIVKPVTLPVKIPVCLVNVPITARIHFVKNAGVKEHALVAAFLLLLLVTK